MIPVKVTLPLYIRKGPGRDHDIIGDIFPSGEVITMDGKEERQNWKGVSTWYYKINEKQEKQWYWGGRLTETIDPLPWGLASLQIQQVWDQFGEQGKNAKVAVLDSGYNIANSDIHNGVKAFRSFTIPNPDTTTLQHMQDRLGHGSHCTSLVGGRNKLHVVGYAPQCQLYIGKITGLGGVQFDVIVKGIRWAIEQGVDIISISYGGPVENEALKKIVQEAVEVHNILVVASIGDDFSLQSIAGGEYPALFGQCIATGASDGQRRLAKISFTNKKTEIYAPGEDISAYSIDELPELMSGSSQAAAIVAGICALIISRYNQLNKPYKVKDIKELLIDNATPLVGAAGLKLINPINIFTVLKNMHS